MNKIAAWEWYFSLPTKKHELQGNGLLARFYVGQVLKKTVAWPEQYKNSSLFSSRNAGR